MTTCVITKKDGLIIGVETDGHASNDNHSLVCNSVSVLMQSLLIGVVNILELDIGFTIESGHLHIKLTDDQAEKSQVLTDTFAETILIIESENKTSMKVEVCE